MYLIMNHASCSLIYIGLTSVMHPVLLPGSRYTRSQVIVGHLLKCRMGPTADSSGILSEGSLATMGSKCPLEEVAEGGKRIKKNEINE